MGIQDFGTIGANATQKEVIDVLADLQDTLNFLLNGNLDVKNLRADSVNADRIKANTITATQIKADSITANEIAANAITTSELKAGAVTADKITVSQLSAIAADLGTITAGIIYGAYIATANGTYPRTEMSTTGNQFAAYQTANSFVKMNPAATSNNPGFNFQNGSGSGLLYQLATDLFMATVLGSANIQISSGKDLFLSANNALKLSGASLLIDNIVGFTGSFSVVTSVTFGPTGGGSYTSKTVTVNKGIVTSVV